MRSYRAVAEAPLNPTRQQLVPLAHGNQDVQFERAFSIIRESIAQCAFPAASLAVTYHGVLVASQGFGRFTYDPDSPAIAAETVFDLASVTKAMATTTIAMLLYERGQLRLDSAVADVLPEFLDFAPQNELQERRSIRVRMLLAHSSGLPAYEKLFLRCSTRDQLLQAAISTPLVAEPGTVAAYSDIGFILVGEILERVAGCSLAEFAQKEVFEPLGMRSTCFCPPEQLRSAIPPTEDDRTFRKRIIQGEVNDENASVMGGIAGHAGLFASATDVARFAECMLRGGAPLLKPETVQVFTRREESPVGTSRALGWDTPSEPSSSGKYFSTAAFGHLGYTGTSLWIDPERRLSVSFLTNRTWPDRSSQAIRAVRPRLHDAIVEALEI